MKTLLKMQQNLAHIQAISNPERGVAAAKSADISLFAYAISRLRDTALKGTMKQGTIVHWPIK